MSNNDKEREKAAEAKKKEITLEGMLEGLPIPDEHKQALMNLVSNMVSSLSESNQRLVAIETRVAAAEDNPKKYDGAGLSGDQIYQIEMAKASAPAAAAQQQLISAVIGSRGQGGGGLDSLVKSAESLTSLRNFLLPPPTAIQMAMEKAQVNQIIAQTRLMNKLTGKTADKYLDDLEKEIAAEGKEE